MAWNQPCRRAVVDARQERVSIAAFHIATLGSTEVCYRYRNISMEDYVRLIVSSKIEGKNIFGHYED
ncbi:hypothetical protein E2562_004858 [Oryza meyeriana var. granulata]|uniref:Uncharacterized protein n=1 Tax=Oryza meyeriana var. granulata TaxID=110450 RepID=A0A6G1C3W8_9ORYZ|nr:hypothetical protein E2562_004858 [Oryza meyeriana var. granulata]